MSWPHNLVICGTGDIEHLTRDVALFNLAIDSKLRGCDVVSIKADDVAPRRTPDQNELKKRQSLRT
jgi:hypothetical protein